MTQHCLTNLITISKKENYMDSHVFSYHTIVPNYFDRQRTFVRVTLCYKTIL